MHKWRRLAKRNGSNCAGVKAGAALPSQRMQERLQHEIEHGRYLAGRCTGEVWNWESPAGRFRWKRRVRMLTNHVGSGANILELGCGTGYFTKELVRTGANVTAIDISPELLEEAR